MDLSKKNNNFPPMGAHEKVTWSITWLMLNYILQMTTTYIAKLSSLNHYAKAVVFKFWLFKTQNDDFYLEPKK